MNTQTKYGGPAFPNTEPNGDVTHPGMSMRDYIATKALPALIAASVQFAAAGMPTNSDAKTCAMAYKFADAMLAEREKGSK